jgi:hypothetical protein
VILGRLLAVAVASGLIGALGCEASVTSVGSWTPDASTTIGPEASTLTNLEAGTEPDASTGTYLEAESGALSGGFVVGNDPTASGGRYLEAEAGVTSDDGPGAARARYELTITTPGTYLVWGRIRSPSTSTNRFWVQVDGGTWFKWRITVGDIWFWDRFHDDVDYDTPMTFPLTAGAHELLLANCVDGVELDRLYYTSGQETPPGNTTPCHPPNSIELQGVCNPSCGAQGGNNCGADVCSGYPILQAYDCAVCCIGGSASDGAAPDGVAPDGAAHDGATP